MSLILPNQSTPATPTGGSTELFVNSSKHTAQIDDTGTVQVLTDASSTQVLSNKSIDDTCKLVDDADNSKVIQPSLGGMTASVTLTLASTQSTSQTLSIPNITAADALVTTGLTQTITGVKTMTNPTTAVGTNAIPSLTITPGGTILTSPVAGAVEADASSFYLTNNTTEGRMVLEAGRYFRLAANATPFTAITDFFGTNSAIGFPTNAVLEIEWHCYFAIATLSTQVVTWTIVNTQTVTNMVANWAAHNALANMATAGALTGAGVVTQTAASVALPNTGVVVIGNHYHIIRATIETATAGNVRLRCNTASTATVGPLRDSFFRIRRLPAGNAGTFVA